MLEVIEQLFEKIEEIEKKLTNHHKNYLSVLKRIKRLENE